LGEKYREREERRVVREEKELVAMRKTTLPSLFSMRLCGFFLTAKNKINRNKKN